MQPTDEQAREAINGLFNEFPSVEIEELGPIEHSEGYEYQIDFRITYPEGTDTSKIPRRHHVINSPFRWLKVVTGINETGRSEMTGTVRCYYGEG